jgi:carboxypeptidase Q
MKIIKFTFFLFAAWACSFLSAQDQDSAVINNLFQEALSSDIAYENLRYLCEHIGPRLCGSSQAAAAVEYTKQILEKMGLDTVCLQNVEVPNWVDNGTESAVISSINGTIKVNTCALGLSVGTADGGIDAEAVEVKTFEELKNLGEDKIAGKIVFYNQPMDPKQINPLRAYSEVSKYRTQGANEAARFGAVAAIIRSLTLSIDEHPHTGGMHYDPSLRKIPAAAICTQHAELLSAWLKKDPHLKFHLKMNCRTLPDTLSHNVIGEIKGSEFPDKIIVVGGHLDSWHLSPGAHDDGAGCIHSIEVLRLFKKLDIKPRHTIRAVLYMDEEINQSGGKVYAEQAKKKNEKHLAALESDGGGDLPIGFSIDAPESVIAKLQSFRDLLIPYGLYRLEKGYGGVDIGPLKAQGVPLIGLTTNLQRYMEYHHSSNDTFDKINKRELQMGAASLASLVYLLDLKFARKKF